MMKLTLLLETIWLRAIAKNDAWEMMQHLVSSQEPRQITSLRVMILARQIEGE